MGEVYVGPVCEPRKSILVCMQKACIKSWRVRLMSVSSNKTLFVNAELWEEEFTGINISMVLQNIGQC